MLALGKSEVPLPLGGTEQTVWGLPQGELAEAFN